MHGICRVEVLGPLRLVRRPAGGGEEVVDRFYSPKAAALLALLAFGLGRQHPREVLIEQFWPDLEPAAGRDNLSTLLSALRRHLEPAGVTKGAFLSADRQNVALNPASVETDAAEWERLTREASRERGDPSARAALLARAVALYRGEPLPGVYEEWAVREQAVWPERYADALERWAAALEEAGDPEAALEAAGRALAADPLREECHRQRMRLLASLGRTAASLEAYEALTARLRDELDARPAFETRRLAERIKDGTLAPTPGPSPAAGEGSGRRDTPQTSASSSPPSPAAGEGPGVGAASPPLPAPLTRILGRDAELAALDALLRDPDGPRIVTLLGPGGAGKTRLAVEAARQAAGDGGPFAGCVYYAPLADLPVPGLVPGAVVRALGLPPDPADASSSALDRAVDALAAPGGPVLLVLDNLEHLIGPPGAKGDAAAGGVPGGAAAYVRLFAERAPGLRLLLTSRRLLGLGGEQAFPVAPLAAPPGRGDADPAVVLSSPAAALFAERARAARPDFAVTAGNAAAVAAICRHLEGIPLAIEIAAAWSRALPPAKVRERLESPLGALVSRRRDVPERHQSVRAAVEWSYSLLEPGLRGLFARLSVFRGGWTLEAAEAVCEDPDALDGVALLEEQSLVVAVPEAAGGEPRWRMLEPIREFAAEKLAEGGEAAGLRRRHADHFAAGFLQRRTKLLSAEAAEGRAWCEAENDNLRAALAWASEEDGELAVRLVAAAGRFWQTTGRYAEGRSWCARALTHPGGQSPTRTRVGAYFVAAYLAADQSDFPASLRASEAAVELCRSGGEAAKDLASALGNLASGYLQLDALDRAWDTFGEAAALCEADGNRPGLINTLVNRGLTALKRADWPAARDLALRARGMMEPSDEIRHLYASKILGYALAALGDPAGAAAATSDALERSLRLCFGLQIAVFLDAFARLARDAGDGVRAGRLFAAADALYARLGSVRIPHVDAIAEAYKAVGVARAADPALAAAWDEGAVWDEEGAAAYALRGVPPDATGVPASGGA